MALRALGRLLIASAIVFVLAQPADLESCGPFFPSMIFVRVQNPENDAAFYSGRLGILQPTFWRRYLAMSYRILQGIPLTRSQIASIPPLRKPSVEDKAEDLPAVKWEKARMEVPDALFVGIAEYRKNDDFTQAKTCSDDAFFTAIATLKERIRQAGIASAEVKDWVAAQDIVFGNCDGSEHEPQPAPAGSSARMVADREYQIAASKFYAGRYDDAKARFLKIAADPGSQWHTLAPYLAARADLRAEKYEAAQTELHAILANPKLAAVHARADALLGFAEGKVDPIKRIAFCGRRLLVPNSRTLARDLIDYTFLYDKVFNVQKPEDEITTWIEMFRRGKEEDMVGRWQEGRSLPWLIAALSHATPTTPQVEELIDAARNLPFDSPAWPTARFHAVRLLNESGRQSEARDLLSELTTHLKGASISMINAFHAEQLMLAGNLDEFLEASPRLPSGEGVRDVAEESEPEENALMPMFDTDADVMFNSFLPLGTWLTVAKNAKLPKRLRTAVAQSGFVRTSILNDSRAVEFAGVLRELKPTYKADLDRYLAVAPERRRFEAVLWMEHHPEAAPLVDGGLPRGLYRETPDGQIDPFRFNWWCSPKAPKVEDWFSLVYKQLYEGGWKSPAFLTEDEKKSAEAETKALAAAGGGPQFLSTAAIAWYRSHPSDPRLPEALARAVKSSGISCTDEHSAGPVSEAFRILHNRYPNNSWTNQTPYWYK